MSAEPKKDRDHQRGGAEQVRHDTILRKVNGRLMRTPKPRVCRQVNIIRQRRANMQAAVIGGHKWRAIVYPLWGGGPMYIQGGGTGSGATLESDIR